MTEIALWEDIWDVIGKAQGRLAACYDIGWGQWNFGRAAALAWILFLIILAIGIINLLVTRRVVRDEGARSSLGRREQRAAARAARRDLRRAASSGTLADAPEPESAPESATDTPEAQR